MATTIHVARDGLVVIGEPLTTAPIDDYVAWCEVVKDALIMRRWDEVYRMLEKHDDDDLTAPPDVQTFTLPLVTVPTREVAKRLVVRFCKLGVGPHPLLSATERWYYIPNFGGKLKDIWEWSDRFEAAK